MARIAAARAATGNHGDPHAIDIVGEERKTDDESRKRVHAAALGQASSSPAQAAVLRWRTAS